MVHYPCKPDIAAATFTAQQLSSESIGNDVMKQKHGNISEHPPKLSCHHGACRHASSCLNDTDMITMKGNLRCMHSILLIRSRPTSEMQVISLYDMLRISSGKVTPGLRKVCHDMII